MKDLLLFVNVVVKTLNLKIVICQTTSKNCTKVRAAARLFFLIQPSRSLFSGVVGNREFNLLNKMNKKKKIVLHVRHAFCCNF